MRKRRSKKEKVFTVPIQFYVTPKQKEKLDCTAENSRYAVETVSGVSGSRGLPAHPLPRSAAFMRQYAVCQRRGAEGYPGMARTQRYFHHVQYIHPSGLFVKSGIRERDSGLVGVNKRILMSSQMSSEIAGIRVNKGFAGPQKFRSMSSEGVFVRNRQIADG